LQRDILWLCVGNACSVEPDEGMLVQEAGRPTLSPPYQEDTDEDSG